MDSETRDILNIIKSGITEKSIEISENVSLAKLNELTNKHNIFTLVYYGVHNCNIHLNDALNKQLTNAAMSGICLSEQQMYYINEISARFRQNNIDYMFLKGSVLKKIYPHKEIRRMGDIDILIKEEQYSLISEVMKHLGFSFCYESDHELVWKKGNIMIEFHKILMPSYNKDFHAYFGNGWQRAILEEKNCYKFSDNDMFVYIFGHFAKHFRDAGIGIIHMCDLYLILNSYNLDFKYIDTELEKLKLYDFWCNVKETIDVWFCGAENSEMTDCITSVIFDSGVYGLKEKSVVSNALKSEKNYKNLFWGKICRLIRKIFPKNKDMSGRYPVLKKFPFLLPIVCIWRWFSLVLTKRGKIKTEFLDIYEVNENDVQEYQKFLNYVGLDYNF